MGAGPGRHGRPEDPERESFRSSCDGDGTRREGPSARMVLEITAVPERSDGTTVAVRAAIFNDSFEPVDVWRAAFVGPTLVGTTAGGMPIPESVEPNYGAADQPIRLAPFTFYGRERVFELPPGKYEFAARYQPTDSDDRLQSTGTITVEER